MGESFILTRYGKIPKNELKKPTISSSFSSQLPNYLTKLYVKEIDSKSLPLTIFVKNEPVQIVPKQFKELHKTKQKTNVFRAGSSGLTELPIKLTPQLAYFVGYFIGDGSLKDIQKTYVKFKRFEHKIKVCDEFLCQVKFLQELFEFNFGYCVPIRDERIAKGERLFYINPTNKVIYRFLTQVFSLPPGPKCYTVSIPEIILLAPKEIKKSFIQGLFDADGDTRAVEAGFHSRPRVKLKMQSEKLITDMLMLVKEVFGVSINGQYIDKETLATYFQIERIADIIKLADEGLFLHPVKRWRLEKTRRQFQKDKV